MTLVVIGPAAMDSVIIGDEECQTVGGATYFQSFVFERYFPDYLAIVNCSDESIANEFPDKSKVKTLLKDNTHYFINEYPDKGNLDIRHQLSNFADIPISKSDLEDVLPEDIDGFVINPLNRNDFSVETVEYLKSFGVPVFMSVQGFLRVPDVEANENYTIKLSDFDKLNDVLSGVSAIFLDEDEANIIDLDCDVDEIVITDGSRGSRIISENEIKIGAEECENIVDATGCGDTYMAAYVSQRLIHKSPKQAGKFASLIASRKLTHMGPFVG